MSICYVNVCGGLGNQLFQVANGFAYSKEHGKGLFINSRYWTAHQGNSPREYKDTIFYKFPYCDVLTKKEIELNETSSEYSRLEHRDGPVALCGYFQSLKYFEKYKDEFVSELCLPKVDTSFLKDGNVAFHIRRGDYLQFKDIHYVCDTDYFINMFEEFNDYQINVFTDSPNHVLKEFEKYNFNLIQTSSELNDLTLMSLHDNIVCSNSSFSWWASILGKEKTKIVVPNKWNNKSKCDDIYYDKMIRC